MAAPEGPPRGAIAKLVKLAFRLFLLIALIMGGAWVASRPAAPDAFYQANLPLDARAGALLKWAPFTTAVPDGARAWRILYVTVRGGGPALSSAVVVTPTHSAAKSHRVVAWAHGTTGVVSGCAPSVMGKPFDNVPDLAGIVREGWAYVGTDYPGLGTDGGHAYLVGEDAARAVLDAVRAARQLQGVTLEDRLVVWGHSQGGNSALWTGMIAGAYAPDLKLMGVAALAPASDLRALVASSKGSTFGKIVSSYLIHSYARAYPNVRADDYVGGLSRVVARDIAGRCTGGYATVFSVMESLFLPSDGIFSTDPTAGPLGARLIENTPSGSIPAPVFIAQGEADDLVVPDVQRRYVSGRCAAGQVIDYRTYAGRDHVSVVAPDSPLAAELAAWTRDRLEGKPAGQSCMP